MSAGAAQIRSVAGRWAAHRKVLEASGMPRNLLAVAMMAYYAGFSDSLAAGLEIGHVEDETEAAHYYHALLKECQAMAAMSAALQANTSTVPN